MYPGKKHDEEKNCYSFNKGINEVGQSPAADTGKLVFKEEELGALYFNKPLVCLLVHLIFPNVS